MAADANLLRFLTACPTAETALATLDPATAAWFRQAVGPPTAAQRFAWPSLARGQNLLVCTPTGSGKTLAAFAPILGRISTDRLAGLRGLYVAPLKALGQDVRRNLKAHGRALQAIHGPDVPPLRVGLRTGDTTQRVRKEQLVDPPHVLLTTPESLALLLTHAAAAELFRDLRWVVVDEVHALAGNKRGADLALSLERLETLATAPAGLQRVGLSATVAPLTAAATFLVGAGRPCDIAQVDDRAAMSIAVEPLPDESATDGPGGFIARLLARLAAELDRNRTTLIFTNTRNLTERLTWALRRRYPDRAESIAAHHSALSAARRRLVERRLKHGELWAAVSSTSLELGVDIGSVDGVVFVHPPGGVVRLLQRLGRSGHRPDEPRRGLMLTASVGDLLEATVTAASSRHTQIEPLEPIDRPLDVLCQHLAGMAMAGPCDPAEVFALVRRAGPYRELSEDDFRDCLDYLSGRRRDGSEWLPARLGWQGRRFVIADDRTARLLRRNLGSIVAETPCLVRLLTSDPPDEDGRPRSLVIGEVDEVYADRLQAGDRFVLDGRCLEVRDRENGAPMVEEVIGRPLAPRWLGGGVPLPRELARRLYLFRVQAAETLLDGDDALTRFLRDDYGLGEAASLELAHYLMLQEMVSEVPDFGTLLIERVGMQSFAEYTVHTPLPRPANETLAQVLALRWRRHFGGQPMTLAANLGFLLSADEVMSPDVNAWRELLRADGFADDLWVMVRDEGLWRPTFGRVAQTGLMVLRQPLGRKRKVGGRDWAERQLFDQLLTVAPDFVLLRQAERETETAVCDGPAAVEFLRQVGTMDVHLRPLSQPSPFGETLLHAQRMTPDLRPAAVADPGGAG